jgi:hypothetical protein
MQPAVTEPGGSTRIDPLRALAEHDRTRATRRAATQGWILPAVFLLTSAIAAAWIIKVYKADRTVTLAIQYLTWAVTAYILMARTRRFYWKVPQDVSLMSRFLILFLAGIAASTAGVWLLGTRRDIGLIGPEIAALIYLALPFFVLARVAKVAVVHRVVIWTCHVILVVGLYSILGDYLGFSRYEAVHSRYFGALGDQVAWALTLPLVVYFSTGRFPFAALAAIGLVLTASRAPTLTVIASILLLVSFSRGRRAQYIVMLFAALTLGLYQAGLFEHLVSRFSTTEFLSNDRIVTAALGIKTFLASPLVGNGYYSLGYLYPTTMHRITLGILPAQTSTFVQILSDHGLIAFVPYLGFVIATTATGIALMRRSIELSDGSILTGVVAWLLAMLWANQSALWLTVGSYIGPLVFGMAGLVAGSGVKLQLMRRPAPNVPAEAPAR